MSSVAISGNASGTGTLTIAAPNTNSNRTLTLPDGTGTFTVNGVNSNIVSGTAQNSTSGTSIDFTGIPSWVKRITVNFAGTSTAGASAAVLIQIGTSGGIQNTGYLSTASAINNANTTVVSNITAGISPWSGASAAIAHGSVVITLLDSSNGTWCFNGQIARSDSTNNYWCAGSKILSGTLDRVRITTTNGTDTFDAGSINILYE